MDWRALLLAAAAWVFGCDEGYQRGDCEPGYLEVDGECQLAVGQACDRNGDCLARICLTTPEGERFCSIACARHADCPSGFYCTTWDDGRCYPGQRPPPCSTDADCGPCERCSDGSCQADPNCTLCAEDGECGPCGRCQDGECIQIAGCRSCTIDAECAICEVCDQGRCQRLPDCIRCGADADCPGCTSCERGACVPIDGCGSDPCFNDQDCPPRTRCLVDTLQGLTVCLPVGLDFGQDCSRGGDATCASGICLAAEDGSSWCSQACAVDADCPTGTVCAPDQDCLWACRPPDAPPPGARCSADRDCQPPRLCGLVADAQAGAWQARCLAPLPCAGEAGAACGPETDGRCRSGLCTPQGFCSSVCAGHLDCPAGFLCVQLALALPDGGPQAPFWACAPRDQARFATGEPCPGGDGQCLGGWCLSGGPGGPGGPRPRCSRGCTPGAADCPDGYSCQPDPDEPDSTRCVPAELVGDCRRDADCPAETVCRPAATTGRPECAAAEPAGAAVGDACLVDADCRHGWCLPEGRCAAPCAAAADCPEPLWCDVRRWLRPQAGASWLSVCSPAPGSLAACQRTADCPPAEVCRLDLNLRGTALEGRCAPPAGGAAAGQPCASPTACASGLCRPLGQCSQPCLADADCPPEMVCGPVEALGPRGASWSLPGCRPAPVGLGEPCPGGDLDCQSGLCHQPDEGEPYCTRSCAAHEDCAAAEDMVCRSDASGTTCRWP